MYYYKITIEKERKNKIKPGKGHENINQTPVYITALEFKNNTDIEKINKERQRNFIESVLQKKGEKHGKYDYNRKEKAYLVKDYNSKNPIYEGEITMPQHLVK